MGFAPGKYTAALAQTLEQLHAPEWQEWWGAANLGSLHIGIRLGWPTPGLKCFFRKKRRSTDDPDGEDKYEAGVQRAYGSVSRQVDPVQQAREDVEAVFAVVRKRAKLPPHPPLKAVVLGSDLRRQLGDPAEFLGLPVGEESD